MGTRAAPAQALGYYYQISYALYDVLRSDVGTRHGIQLEGLDDIEHLSEDKFVELLELKHHISHGSISDRSVDLWRTIRIWSIRFKEQQIELPGTKLKLITTASAPKDSVAELLCPTSYAGARKRNPDQACQRLQDIARSPSDSLKQFTSAFNELSPVEQQVLVNAIEIFDCSPTIIDVEEKIKNRFEVTVPPEKVDDFFDLIMGMWRRRVISHLSGDHTTISTNEIKLRIIEESQRYYSEPRLPPYSRDLLREDLSELPNPETDERMFVRQLLRITIDRERIADAIYDHHRAITDRNRWVDEELYWEDKLYSYDTRLVNKWRRIQLRHRDKFKREHNNIDVQEADDQTCIYFGQELYDEISELDVGVNKQTNYSYITRGSYHDLADRLNVWWHPKFKEEIENE
jgi:hypothetical protein